MTTHVTLLQDTGYKPDVLAAVVGDAVAGAVAGEHHVAGVHDGGLVVVRDLGFALQDVVDLRILDMRMLLDPAPGRKSDDVEHRGALEHLRRREDDVLLNPAFDITLILNGFDSNVLFVFYHCCLFFRH